MNISDLEKKKLKTNNFINSHFKITWPFVYPQSLERDWYAMSFLHPVNDKIFNINFTNIKY